jgi:hypothetical protein
MAKAKSKTRYSVHPGVVMVQDFIEKLPEKTGKSLDQWLALVRTEGPATTKERRAWLKEVHKLGTNYAMWIVEQAEGKGAETSDPKVYLQAAEEYVEKMYSGAKEHLRPLFEALLELGLSMGAEAKACPCQTMVPLYRNHVFAQIKPTTRTRIDFGLALGDAKASGKLIDTGGFAKKDRITHRFEITSLADIDTEVRRWLKQAYDRDA